jgi:hypothetical protein
MKTIMLSLEVSQFLHKNIGMLTQVVPNSWPMPQALEPSKSSTKKSPLSVLGIGYVWIRSQVNGDWQDGMIQGLLFLPEWNFFRCFKMHITKSLWSLLQLQLQLLQISQFPLRTRNLDPVYKLLEKIAPQRN